MKNRREKPVNRGLSPGKPSGTARMLCLEYAPSEAARRIRHRCCIWPKLTGQASAGPAGAECYWAELRPGRPKRQMKGMGTFWCWLLERWKKKKKRRPGLLGAGNVGRVPAVYNPHPRAPRARSYRDAVRCRELALGVPAREFASERNAGFRALNIGRNNSGNESFYAIQGSYKPAAIAAPPFFKRENLSHFQEEKPNERRAGGTCDHAGRGKNMCGGRCWAAESAMSRTMNR